MPLAHTYTSLELEADRTMEFYSEARVDGLQKRVNHADKMTEYFVGRDDFLHLRHTEFGKRGKKAHLAGTRPDVSSRPIVVWARQGQENSCPCVSCPVQNTLLRGCGSLPVGTAVAVLQLGRPSPVQLLCPLTESHSLGHHDLESVCQGKEKTFWKEIFTRVKNSQLVSRSDPRLSTSLVPVAALSCSSCASL